MDEFKLNVTVEVDQVGNGLAIQTPVNLKIAFGTGCWRASGESPAFETDARDSLDQAVIEGARQAKAELQAAVIERPRVIARITPEDVPAQLM
jgi:hypothetical protein